MRCFPVVALLFATVLQAQEQPSPKYSVKNPPPYDYDLFRKDVQVISGHVEFLFWRVQEGCLDYALTMKNPAWSNTVNSYAQGSYRNQSWNGDPGFRVATSFYRAPHYWEIKWEYTRFTGRGSDFANKPGSSSQYLTGTWPQIIPTLTSAQSNIHMNYNIFDMLVDRVFNPNPHLRLRLIGGGSLAWINQNWVTHYFDASANMTRTQNKWDYLAGGLKGGFMVDWFWGLRNFYMCFKTVMGGFLGTYENKTKQMTTYPVSGANTNIPFCNARYNDVRPSFTFQMQIGPSFQKNFTDTRIEIFAGYELNGWLNLHEVYRSSSGLPQDTKSTYINASMLTLQGLTTRFTMDF